jgi:hypothetical protein
MKLITTIYRDAALLPHFLNHYATLGVDAFLIGVFRNSVPVEEIFRLCRGYCCCVSSTPRDFNVFTERALKRRLCLSFVDDDEWWVVADLDEFHEYPVPLKLLHCELENAGYSYLQSQFLDRITSDGHLPRFEPAADLWEHFPAAAYISRDLQQQPFKKVMLVRGHSPVGTGHHRPDDGARGHVRTGGVVHHFKWYGSIIEKAVERRKSLVPGSRVYQKFDKLLQFWEKNGRLPVAGEFGFHYPAKPVGWPKFSCVAP